MCILYILAGSLLFMTPGCYVAGEVIEPHRVIYTSHIPHYYDEPPVVLKRKPHDHRRFRRVYPRHKRVYPRHKRIYPRYYRSHHPHHHKRYKKFKHKYNKQKTYKHKKHGKRKH